MTFPGSWLIVVSLTLLTASPSPAQLPTPNFETLSTDNGLPQNSVYRIYQDRKGFIWFGTADGLSRYDGETIKVFKSQAEVLTPANANAVRGMICESPDGRIWYANETGIYYFDPFLQKVNLAINFVEKGMPGFIYYIAITLDSQNNLWLLDPSHGLVRYAIDSAKTTSYRFPPTLSSPLSARNATAIGSFIYFDIADHPGILRFNTADKQYSWILPEQKGTWISARGNGYFLIRKNKLISYDSTTQVHEPISFDTNADIIEVITDKDGRIWIATLGDGLHAYIPQEKKFLSYRHNPLRGRSLPFDHTYCLLTDATDNLWIGTDGGGAARLNLKPPRFNRFPLSGDEFPELRDFFVRCMYEDEAGQIWFGTLHDGLSVYDPANNILRTYRNNPGDPFSLHGNDVTALLRMDNGDLMVAHENGASILNIKKGTFTKIPWLPSPHEKNHSNRIYQLQKLNDRRILASTFFGIRLIDQDAQGNYSVTVWMHVNWNVGNLLANPDGTFWIASLYQGLQLIDPVKNPADSVHRKEPNFFDHIGILSLHRDELDPGFLWICSTTGLIYFNTVTHQFKVYGEKEGLAANAVYGVVEDEHHDLWLSTNMGLSFLDRATGTFRNFTVKDGLKSNEFNSGAYYKGVSGKIYFGGVKGFNWFETGAEKSRLNPPRSAIISIKVNDEPVGYVAGRTLDLPYTRNDISFETAVLEYSHSESNRVQFMLEGWAEHWTTSYIKSVTYHNLPPGQYMFRVRGSAGGSAWGSEEHLTISIKAPFWQTSWFYGGSGLIFLGGVVAMTRNAVRRRISRKLREVEKQKAVLEERERISKDIHDDLGSGLSKIVILSEVLRNSPTADSPAQQQLTKIASSARELIDNLGNLIWSSNPSNDSVKKLLMYLRETMGSMFEDTSIRLNISLPDLTDEFPVPASWRRNVFLAIKESLHNILKHSSAHQAVLKVGLEANLLIVCIEDDGVGFDVLRQSSSGNGLTNIRKRVRECGGSIDIDSKSGKGTTIVARIPIPS